MSYSSKAYLAYEERRLEPGAVIRTGNSRRHTAMSAKNKWVDSLTDEQREQLRRDHENELKRIEQWK